MKYAPHWLVAFALASGSLLCAQVTPWHGVVPPPDRTPHKVAAICLRASSIELLAVTAGADIIVASNASNA